MGLVDFRNRPNFRFQVASGVGNDIFGCAGVFRVDFSFLRSVIVANIGFRKIFEFLRSEDHVRGYGVGRLLIF